MTVAQASDHDRVRRFYADIDRNLRLFGAEHLGRRNIFVRLARYTSNASIDWAEVQRVLARIDDLDSWHGAWSASAAAYEDAALEALERGDATTAGEHFVRAAQLYHWSQINVPPYDERKLHGRRLSIAAYRRGAPLVTPTAVALTVAHGGAHLPGYLRVPPGSDPADLVVLVNGANSVKEELHLWTDALLARGLATMTFDGPGQGESSPAMGGPPLQPKGFEEAISAAIDTASRRLGDRLRAVAVWGNSFGGHLALRGAAHDPRVRAALSVSGFYDFRDFARVPLPVQEELRDLMGLETIDDAIATMDRDCSLDDCARPLRCPLLVVHGAKDDLVGVDEARDMRELAGDRGELVVYEDGVHCCYNRSLDLRASVGDWLVRKLGGDDAFRHRRVA